MQVAEQHKPHPAERRARLAAVDAQRLIDAPHEVRPHHRNLVDDEILQLAHDAAIARAADIGPLQQARRQAEERMDRLAADVHRGEAGRRDHHDLVTEHVADRAQQRRFAGTRAPRHERMPVPLQNVLDRG